MVRPALSERLHALPEVRNGADDQCHGVAVMATPFGTAFEVVVDCSDLVVGEFHHVRGVVSAVLLGQRDPEFRLEVP